MTLNIPGDAFSDGQVRSKLWLAKKLESWNKSFLDPSKDYTLNWYGSWVGLGPFMVLSTTSLRINHLNLIELDPEALRNSGKILEHWRINGLKIDYLNTDMNLFKATESQYQLFINTSCEHVHETSWLEKIPKDHFIVLQSTDMMHDEHINCSQDLTDFKNRYSPFIQVLDLSQIDFSYPGKLFSRFMLFGRKCN